jgi:peptidoglycan/LPS O-acetylase OafA/YrhL
VVTIAPTDRTLGSLQVCRGVAAVMVVLFHFVGGVFLFAHSAIDFFFVLSGFIMLYVHHAQAGRAGAVRPFLVARVVRIFPLYWLVLAATIVYYLYEPAVWEHRLEPLTVARAVLLYDQLSTPVVPVAWTLSYELAFYLVFAVYLALGRVAFAGVAVLWASLVVAQWTGLAPLDAPLLLSPLMLEFLLGCVAAWLVLRFRPRIHGVWLVLAVALCLAVGIADSAGLIDSYQNVRNYALPFFLLVTVSAWYERAYRPAFPRPLLLLGDASYAIYLVHFLGRQVVFQLLDQHPVVYDVVGTPLVRWLMAGALVGAGVVIHVVVERPLLAFARRALAVGKDRRVFERVDVALAGGDVVSASPRLP